MGNVVETRSLEKKKNKMSYYDDGGRGAHKV